MNKHKLYFERYKYTCEYQQKFERDSPIQRLHPEMMALLKFISISAIRETYHSLKKFFLSLSMIEECFGR